MGMNQDQFFTLSSFGSLAGASAIVFVVSNALQGAVNFNPKWFALVLSILVGLFGIYLGPRLVTPPGPAPDSVAYMLGVLNGFLIYTTAAGVTSIGAGATGAGNAKANEGSSGLPAPGASALLAEGIGNEAVATARRSFWHPWF